MADENIKNQDDDYIEISIPSQEEAPQEKTVKETQKTPAAVPQATRLPVKKKMVKKKLIKKEAVQPRKAPRKDEASGNWIWIALIVVGIIVIATVIIISVQKKAEPTKTGEEVANEQVAALVNDQPIYLSELNEIYAQLPEQMRAETSKEALLDQFIDQEILMQEAEKQKLKVTDEEAIAYTEELKKYFGLTDELFTQALESQGLTLEEFQENNKKQILVTKLLNKTVLSKITVTEEDVQAYYDENKKLFVTPETVTIKHILITAEEGEDDDAVLQRAKDVKDSIDDDFENFCDLVTEHSQDTGSVETCGQYDVAQNGQYVAEFEEAAFDMDVDDVKIVKTTFGQHIMWKVSVQDETTTPVEDVAEQIENFLKQDRSNAAVLEYVKNLRDDATIEKYPLENEAVSTVPATVEEEQAKDDEMEVTVEVTEPVREGTFGECLKSAGATLYGVSWSPQSEEQIDLLGESFTEINYVDCDKDNCSALGANPVYPSWMIGEKKLQGLQSINALSQETGCSI